MKFVRLAAVFGLSISLRALATLTMRAIVLVGAVRLNVGFQGTEADARSWLTQERRRLLT